MRTGQVFSIRFYTANQKKKQGGKRIEIDEAVLYIGKEYKKTIAGGEPTHNIAKKDPNHYENDTANIRIKSSGQVRKLHIRLITRFNNKKVLW